MAEFVLVLAAGFVAGSALVWVCKTRIQALVIDANRLSAQLHAEADAIAATIKKV